MMLHGALWQGCTVEEAARTPRWPRRPPSCVVELSSLYPFTPPASFWGAPSSLSSQAGPSPPILGSHSASLGSGEKYQLWSPKQIDSRRLEQVPECPVTSSLGWHPPSPRPGLAHRTLWSPISGLSLHSVGFGDTSSLTST